MANSRSSSVIGNFSVRVGLLCLNFGTGIVVARSLQPAGRGEQTAIALWPILVAGLATLGIPASLTFWSRRNAERAGSLLFAAELTAIVVGVVAAGIGVLAMPLWLRGYDPGVVQQAQWLMLFTPQCLLLYVIKAHLESRGEFMQSVVLGQLVPVLFTLIALMALSWTHRLTPWTAALAYFLPTAVQTVWLAFRLRSRMIVRIRGLRDDLRTLLSYGVRSYGIDVVNSLSLQLDQVVIVSFLSPTALGLYAVALSLTRVINVVQQSMVMVLFPHASGLDTEDALVLVGRALRMTNAAALVLGTLFLLVTPLVLPVLYGRGFAAAIPILPILTLEAVLGGAAAVFGQAFSATGRPAVVTLVQVGWLASVLALLVALVPRLHIAGAAVALLLASILRIRFLAIAYRVVLGRAPPRFFPDAADLRELVLKLQAVLRVSRGRRAADTDHIPIATAHVSVMTRPELCVAMEETKP